MSRQGPVELRLSQGFPRAPSRAWLTKQGSGSPSSRLSNLRQNLPCRRSMNERFQRTARATNECMKRGVNSRASGSSVGDSTQTVAAGQYARISGVRELADKYDALLVDSYGVLHDGES